MDKNKFNTVTFKEYLDNGPLVGKHNLTPNGNLSFHWANWDRSCEYQKGLLFKNKKQTKRLKNLERDLEKYKEQKAWLSIKRERYEVSLYDLYKGYLDPRLRTNWFDIHAETLVSLDSVSGPYVTLHSMRWFNKEIYEKFVYLKILSQYMPLRSFRLGVDIPVVGIADDSPLKSFEMNLYQLSKHGAVFKISGQKNITNLFESKSATLKFNLHPFKETMNAGAKDLIKHFSKIDFSIINEDELIEVRIEENILSAFGNNEVARATNGNDHFLFIPYKSMCVQNELYRPDIILAKAMLKIEEYLLEEIREQAQDKAA